MSLGPVTRRQLVKRADLEDLVHAVVDSKACKLVKL